MSHQDDLQTDYKAASNEQPSEHTDQLILQAAADAVKEDSKVIQGRFSIRRWQTPVSLAAAAVITVSVVTSLKPWQVSVPVTTSTPSKTEVFSDSKSDELKFETADNFEKSRDREQNIVADKELKRVKESPLVQTEPMIVETEITDVAEEIIQETEVVAARSAAIEEKRFLGNNKQHLMEQQLVAKQQAQKSKKMALPKAKASPIALKTTFIYPKPRTLPLFKLVDHKGQAFSNTQLTGKWSVMFFGYTHCPDICPTTITALAKVAEKLTPKIRKHVQFVFISIDPERDTTDLLADYMAFFRTDFLAATGDEQQLQQLTMSLGAMYMKVPGENSYSMSHSNSLFIINLQGQRHGIIANNTGSQNTGIIDVSSTADDLNTIVTSSVEF
ncbi:MAG: SCO family protein [Gammaproteobacteria bacterium]|nr:SCO family protein [Gammaproteobacteria bacterium]